MPTTKRKKKAATTALATKAQVTKDEPQIADDVLVNEAVAEIKKRWADALDKGNAALLSIGDYLIQKFWNGKTENVELRGRGNVSYRALAAHTDLPFSSTHLHGAVQVAKQHRLLLEAGVPDIDKLSATHQVELARVADIKAKKKLIGEVLDKSLSVRQLQERIADGRALPGAVASSAEEGRTTIPRPLLTFIRLDLDRLTNPERLGKLGKAQVNRYRKTLEEAQERIKALIKALGQAK